MQTSAIAVFLCLVLSVPAQGEEEDAFEDLEPSLPSIGVRQGSSSSCLCGVSQTVTGGSKRSQQAVDVDRIVGGTRVPYQGKYPWMVWFGIGPDVFMCGGALINDRYVLTASHCVEMNVSATFYVTLGDLDMTTTDDSQSIQLKASAIMHPEYSTPTFVNNDITLLKLETPVDFVAYPHIRPICLSSTFIPNVGETVTVAGWGINAEGGQYTSSTLLETTLRMISTNTCKKWFGSAINNNFLCAQEKGHNICQGDSGGPLMYKTEAGYYLTVGINSFVAGGCITSDGGAFTKVANYVDNFIRDNTKGANWCSTP